MLKAIVPEFLMAILHHFEPYVVMKVLSAVDQLFADQCGICENRSLVNDVVFTLSQVIFGYFYRKTGNPSCVEIQNSVAFKSRNFLFREIYVGNTSEPTWPNARSFVLKCISTTNTNFVKESLGSNAALLIKSSRLQLNANLNIFRVMMEMCH